MRDDGLDPVLQAAATAFGFVYVHPFQDGNGRLHRCLIHHVLAERKFTPPGMVFPVSSVMLDRIDDYRTTLQAHSGPLMPFIEWRPTPERNVEVLNDTADLYRYFDCTEAAEFLYACVRRTVEQDLPREIDYLRRHDEAIRRIMDAVEMPDRVAENLVMFIRQNKGTLSKKRREGEFKKLRDDEVTSDRRHRQRCPKQKKLWCVRCPYSVSGAYSSRSRPSFAGRYGTPSAAVYRPWSFMRRIPTSRASFWSW